jgi:GNAT superfamily N-acetyltransferase
MKNGRSHKEQGPSGDSKSPVSGKSEPVEGACFFYRETTLKDGTSVFIRLLCPDDREELKRGFQKLSDQSRYCRFHMHLNKLSDDQLSYLTEVDNYNHLALGAGLLNREEDVGIGIARYVRFKEHPTVAEFAVTVIDEYQNRGLGRILLDFLLKAASNNGIERLVGFVVENNRLMVSMLKHYEHSRSREGGDLLRVELPTERTPG